MELSILLMEQIAKLFLMIFMGYAVVKLGLLTDMTMIPDMPVQSTY